MTDEHKSGLAQVISAAQIGGVRLIELRAKTRVRNVDEVSDEAHVAVQHAGRLEAPPGVNGTFFVVSMVEARVALPDPKEEPLLWVKAAFELRYRLPKEVAASKEDLERFAQTNGVFNAWPYFREIIQTTTTRMNLPPIVLPLFRLKVEPPEPAEKPKRRRPTKSKVRHA